MSTSVSSALLFPFFLLCLSTSPSLADHDPDDSSSSTQPQEYLDPSLPPLLLPTGSRPCSLPILGHDFATTHNSTPASAPYSPPPGCPAPWARIVLDLSVSCTGRQHNRIAAVWLGGVELLRTSTAEPAGPGAFWRVRKDVTRYSHLLRRPDAGNVSMMLENAVDSVFAGVYSVNVSLDFYPDPDEVHGNGGGLRSKVRLVNTEEDPADLILPISNHNANSGSWFRIHNKSDIHSRSVRIPRNAFRAVLELYVSYHSYDESWYSHPPNSYIEKNNLTRKRGNGPLREVFATIDRRYVGSVVPFPVIFPAAINRLLWTPVVAIGAFDLPSYDLDVTPFLGLILDGKPHKFGLGVANATSFWLVSANLHLWLDPDSTLIEARLTRYQAPPLSVFPSSKFHLLNGTFRTDAERKAHFSGWANSSLGNFTCDVVHKLKLKSSLVLLNNGNYKEVHLKAKAKMGVRILEGLELVLSVVAHKYKFPLMIVTSVLPGENSTYTLKTNLSHSLYEEIRSHSFGSAARSRSVADAQDANGWMLVRNGSVVEGSADTRQSYQYRGSRRCFNRKVSAKDGELLSDSITHACPPPKL